MAIQTFTAGQTLTAAAMNTLQASDYNYTRKVITTATYTVVLEDRGQLLEFQNAGGTTVTIPLNSSVAYDVGDVLELINGSTATVSIVGDTGVTIEATGDITSMTSEWQRATLVKRETNNWLLVGLTSVSILDSAIVTADISDGAVTTSKIANAAVTTGKITDSAVTTAKIADEAITSAKIANGTIVNADINAAAAIDKTKIVGTAITAADTGTITNAMIETDTITDGKIKSTAAIAHSKLANITAGQVLLGNASNVPTATALSGDVTVNSSGVTAIGSGVIVNADIDASAAIGLGKLADATIEEQNNSYALVLADKNKFIKMNVTSTANTVTVPTNASAAFPVGSQIHIIQYGSGKTQVVGVSGTVTIYATPGTYLRAQYSSATLLKCDTNMWLLMGDLSES